MSIRKIGPSRWFIRVRSRQNGKMFGRKQVVTGTQHEAQKVEIGLREALAAGSKISSLKIRFFGEALQYYRENSSIEMSHIGTLFDKLDRDLGTVPINQLAERFTSYWTRLKNDRSALTGCCYASSTRNHLLGYAKTALNFCVARGLVERNPLVCFHKIQAPGRDRVLTDEERDRLLMILERRGSYLFWPVRFSLKNPIRRGDLMRLTRENIDWFQPWVHFYPGKTKNIKPRETCLPFIDDDLLSYLKTVPPGGLLFARVSGGRRLPLGDFKVHWHSILAEAGINDFHWHDLKHCAITWILDNGFSERDLKNLGIQYSKVLIDRYYHHDARKVVAKWKKSSIRISGVAPECGPIAEKTANFV